MQNKTQNLLPKMIPGTVHAQFVRCGKLNCKCTRGNLHGPYFYHFTRLAGRLRKRYLKASEVKELQRSCLARQNLTRSGIELSRVIWISFREIRNQLRETETLIPERRTLNAKKKR